MKAYEARLEEADVVAVAVDDAVPYVAAADVEDDGRLEEQADAMLGLVKLFAVEPVADILGRPFQAARVFILRTKVLRREEKQMQLLIWYLFSFYAPSNRLSAPLVRVPW